MPIEISHGEGRELVLTIEAAGQLLDRFRAAAEPVVLVVREPADDQLLTVGIHRDRGFVHRAPLQGDAACWSCQSTIDGGSYYLPGGEPAFTEVPYEIVRTTVQQLLAHAPE